MGCCEEVARFCVYITCQQFFSNKTAKQNGEVTPEATLEMIFIVRQQPPFCGVIFTDSSQHCDLIKCQNMFDLFIQTH